ncbi:hypothetical protein U1Q18_018415 [Sarracenia purpurea var. burkii]
MKKFDFRACGEENRAFGSSLEMGWSVSLLVFSLSNQILPAESFCGEEYGDISSANGPGRSGASLTKGVTAPMKKRIPLSVRKTCQNYVDNPQNSEENDWHIEVAVPKTQNVYLEDVHNEESEGSSVTKTFKRMSNNITSTQDIGYEYESMDDRQECSSVSNLVTSNFETKSATASHYCVKEVGLVKQIVATQQFATEEISSDQKYSVRTEDCRSLDSTITQSSSPTVRTEDRRCCMQTVNELASIRKQLLEIENKQSNLMDMLKVFTLCLLDIYGFKPPH